MYSVRSLDKLIGQLTRLPGIGERSARRLAFHILRQPVDEAAALANALLAVKRQVKTCPICHNFCEDTPCPVCRDARRDRTRICVVEEPQDIFLFERIGEYRGLYHVLGGSISPLRGVHPDNLTIGQLVKRVQQENIAEIILATDPDTEGEATAIFVARALRQLPVRVSRLAHGLPAGGNLEYADEVTLAHAFRGRHEVLGTLDT